LRIFGIEADRLVEIGERLRVAAGLAVDRAAGVVGLRIKRIARDHVGERGEIGVRRGGSWLRALGPGRVEQKLARTAADDGRCGDQRSAQEQREYVERPSVHDGQR
jgi:hypothetical protein